MSDIYPQISHLLPFPRSATITKPVAPFCRLFVATARSRGSIFREFVDTSSSSRKPSSSARSSLNSLRAESHHRRSGDQISPFFLPKGAVVHHYENWVQFLFCGTKVVCSYQKYLLCVSKGGAGIGAVHTIRWAKLSLGVLEFIFIFNILFS